MFLTDAHAFGLATTLMAVIAIFKAGDGAHSVTPANESLWRLIVAILRVVLIAANGIKRPPGAPCARPPTPRAPHRRS